MKLKTSSFTTKLAAVAGFLKRYVVIIFLVVLCGIYGYMAYRINSLTQAEPSDAAIAEKLKASPRPRIDQQAIDKMNQLEDENIEVHTLFQQARNNPFSE